MADRVKLDYKESSGDFRAYSEGAHPMRLVDVVDLGLAVKDFAGQDPEIKHVLALVFAGGERQENGDLITVSKEVTNSLHAKATLRLTLEAIRGKAYTEEQAMKASRDELFLNKIVNAPCLVTVQHKTSKKGRTYAQIVNVTSLPKGLMAPEIADYKRQPFWETRKAENAEAVAKFRPKEDEPIYPEDMDAETDEDSDLPW